MMTQTALQSFTLAHASLKVRYRQTFSGFLWVIVNPLILLGTQGFIFSFVFKISILDYLFYFASGLIPWIFINQTLDMGTSQLRVQSNAIKSYLIRPQVLTLSISLENIVNFLAISILIMTPLLIHNQKPLWILFFWILNIIPLVISVTSLTFIFSSSNVLFKDVRFLVNFMLTISYFLTPIFYRIELLPDTIQKLMTLNPFYILIRPFQIWSSEISISNWALYFSYSLLMSSVVIVISFWYWKKIKNEFYLQL